MENTIISLSAKLIIVASRDSVVPPPHQARGRVINTYGSHNHGKWSAQYRLYTFCICTEVLCNDQNHEKNDQAAQYNLHCSAALRFVSAKEPGTRVKL